MDTAFSCIASGAAATNGILSMSAPSLLATSVARFANLGLSTHEPMCHTHGRPSFTLAAFDRSDRNDWSPSPASSLTIAGSMYPALASSMALHPVVSTSTSFLRSSRAMMRTSSLSFVRMLLQPANSATPRTLPLWMLSTRCWNGSSGFFAANRCLICSTLKPATVLLGFTSGSFVTFPRRLYASAAMVRISFAASLALSGTTSMCVSPTSLATSSVEIILVWTHLDSVTSEGRKHW